MTAAYDDLMALRSEFFSGRARNGLQGKAVKILHKHQPCEWESLLEKRARVMCSSQRGLARELPPSNIDWKVFIPSVQKLAKALGPPNVMFLIKTWLNSWTTSERMHDEVKHGCIFCCGGGDALSHYLRCDHLWTILVTSAKLSVEWLNLNPLKRLGFMEANQRALGLVCVAFRLYHAMKGRRDDGRHDPDDPSGECEIALELANHFIRDLPLTLRIDTP